MPLSVTQLQAVQTVVTHANCADGLASAMIIKDAIPHVKIVFLQHNSKAHAALEATSGMLFCDFSPHPSKVVDFVARGAIVLDHHKTSQSIVAQFGANGIYADEDVSPGVSGAFLAFKEVWQTIHGEDLSSNIDKYALVRDFAILAGIRDTWVKTSPRWEEANCQSAALMFYPQESWLDAPSIFYDKDPKSWTSRLQLGAVLLQKNLAASQRALDGAYKFTSAGIRVAMFPGLSLTSDAAEMVRESTDLVIGFGFTIETTDDMANWTEVNNTAKGPKLIASCRSNQNFDASAFAASLGGGGHTRAAGFSVNLNATDVNPFAYLKTLVDVYTSTLPR